MSLLSLHAEGTAYGKSNASASEGGTAEANRTPPARDGGLALEAPVGRPPAKGDGLQRDLSPDCELLGLPGR